MSGRSPGEVLTVAQQVASAVTTTGRYSWQLDITLNYGTPIVRTVTGTTFVVAEDASAFGAGWTFHGADRLVDITASGSNPAGQLRVLGSTGWAFYTQLTDRLSHLGGVSHVGLTSHLPMHRYGWNGEMTREGGNPWGPRENPLVEYRWLHGDYLQALNIPVLKGRALDSRDGKNTTNVTSPIAKSCSPI